MDSLRIWTTWVCVTTHTAVCLRCVLLAMTLEKQMLIHISLKGYALISKVHHSTVTKHFTSENILDIFGEVDITSMLDSVMIMAKKRKSSIPDSKVLSKYCYREGLKKRNVCCLLPIWQHYLGLQTCIWMNHKTAGTTPYSQMRAKELCALCHNWLKSNTFMRCCGIGEPNGGLKMEVNDDI